MQYADAKAGLFGSPPEGTTAPQPVSDGGPARRLRDAFEPVSMHAVWSPRVHEELAARGLDFFGAYVWGRAFPMGEPTGTVVASAFAAFEPTLIAGIYEQARSLLGRDEVYRITWDSTAAGLRSTLGDDEEATVASVADRLAVCVDGLDATGRPLFAGVTSLDWPHDPYGRLFQACLALREHRGDGHVAAYLGAGFGPIEMNVLTELWLGYPLGEYSGTRAWPEEATAAALAGLRDRGLLAGEGLTEQGHATREAVEDATDARERRVVDMLGDDLDEIVGHLSRWGDRCIEAETFPPDPRKRAAG
ncbi:MAG: hypothetical protein AAGD18_24880 [Actinomycetota bacterium]